MFQTRSERHGKTNKTTSKEPVQKEPVQQEPVQQPQYPIYPERYLVRKFFVTEFGKDEGMATEKLYLGVANFANENNLEIKNVSRINDDSLKLKSVVAIFERREY